MKWKELGEFPIEIIKGMELIDYHFLEDGMILIGKLGVGVLVPSPL